MSTDDGEFFRQYKDAQQERRAKRLPVRQEEIRSLVNDGYTVKELTPYQFRINDTYDLYPIHNRWHHLKSGKRGGAKSLALFIKQTIHP